jgi:hypothetical protein
METSSASITDMNNISTAILTYTPKIKAFNIQVNGLYSRYNITGDSMALNFENITVSEQMTFKSGFISSANASWFRNNVADSTGSDIVYCYADAGYAAGRVTGISAGVKAAVGKSGQAELGYVLKAGVRIYKGLHLNTEFQKIINGDYYATSPTIIDFPYYMSCKMLLNF